MSGGFPAAPDPSFDPADATFGIQVRASTDLAPVIVSVTGEVDLATAAILATALETASAGQPPLVVLDTGTLSFMDAHGLGVVVAARESLRTRSVDLLIRDPPVMLRRVLGITGLTSMVERS